MSEFSVGLGHGSDVAGAAAKLARFRESFVYDAFARIPLVLWLTVCATGMLLHLRADASTTQEFGIAFVLEILARLAGLGFVVCLCGALVLRVRPLARAAGLLPRIAAIGGTFSITAIGLFPRADLSPAIAGASLSLMLIGYGIACYTVTHLGRSLSIMPEARRLVTSGPYAFVRHPLYVAETVASVGLLLQFLSLPSFVLWTAHITLQCCRMHYEEQVLQQTFAEYTGYAERVARLLPSVY